MMSRRTLFGLISGIASTALRMFYPTRRADLSIFSPDNDSTRLLDAIKAKCLDHGIDRSSRLCFEPEHGNQIKTTIWGHFRCRDDSNLTDMIGDWLHAIVAADDEIDDVTFFRVRRADHLWDFTLQGTAKYRDQWKHSNEHRRKPSQ